MCGIFGIYNHLEASNHAYLGLYALQHRGQESAGIVSSDNRQLYHYRQMGLVSETFTKDVLKKLPGKSAIGHVRYSTAGTSELKNAQPFVVDYYKGSLALPITAISPTRLLSKANSNPRDRSFSQIWIRR